MNKPGRLLMGKHTIRSITSW